MQKEKIEITLKYYKSEYDSSKNTYYGSVVEPKYLNELVINIFEDEYFDEKKEDFVKSGKLQLVISGSDRSLEEMGKYLITVARYKTKDPMYHDHFDNIKNSDGEEVINLIIEKTKPPAILGRIE